MAALPDRRPTRPTHVRYIDKSRVFYAAKGYERPYEWAAHDSVPFTTTRRPLAESRIAVVTTSFLHRDDRPTEMHDSAKAVYSHPVADRPDRMFTADLSWDKQATHTDDVETFLPLGRLQEAADSGRVGSVNRRFFGVPTEYSQRKSLLDAEVIAGWCHHDSVDVVILVPL